MLSSVEVGTLITALGCGIGKDEFDISKLRYQRIIIMTDADVDGSHIRTLLLTFIYRQMPELIEHGYVYIAQPPLYKIKKGKQERYIKDESERDAYLLEQALDDAALRPATDAEPITGEALKDLADDYIRMNRAIERLKRRYYPPLLDAMRALPPLDSEQMKDKEIVEAWFRRFETELNNDNADAAQYTAEVFLTADSQEYGGRVRVTIHGLESDNVFAPDFFASKDYQQLIAPGRRVPLGEGASIRRGDQVCAIRSVKEAFDWLLEESAKGMHIQRYKGLGEMNPEQLWETTMNADTRSLSQVRIEDAVAADDIFTTLMGDQVEPRREFIESNALLVANLDT